jgi:hypothetical protein
MKRTLTLALGLVIGASFATQAIAQDAFPDTPENHWAYEALAKMKNAGLLVGYPDGYFRGGRPASRYEMAVALHALWQHLKGMMDGYETRIKTLENQPEQDLSSIKKMLEDMRAEMAGMKAWGDDIANLKKMASTFEKELASMGVDIEALKKSVNDLAARVTALEKRKPAVDIHGDVGMWMWGGYSTDGNVGITVDGRPTGFNTQTGNSSSVDNDFGFLHEGHLALTGTNDTGPKWKAVLAIGNMLDGEFNNDGFGSTSFGSQSTTASGAAWRDDRDQAIYFQEFSAWWDFNIGGQTGSFKMGRQGGQVGNFFLKRPDTTPYYSNQYWDNRDWLYDGGTANFNFGGTNLKMWVGRVGSQETNNGDTIQPMYAGRIDHPFYPGEEDRPRGLSSNGMFVESMFGATLGIKLTEKGTLNLNWIQLDDKNEGLSDGIGGGANRVVVYGGEFGFNLGSWMLNAGYSQSNVNSDDTVLVDDDNAAMWASLSTKSDKWGIELGARSIEPQFAAPGDWGRLGIWWNPTDIEGFYVKANFALNDNLMVHGSAEMYTGSDTSIGGFVGLTSDDEISSYKLDLVYKLSENVNFWVGAEIVQWTLVDRAAPGDGTSGGFIGGEVDERWYNIGFRYNMSENAWWSVRWQISDYDSNGVEGMDPFGFGGSTAKGGLISSTLGIKF